MAAFTQTRLQLGDTLASLAAQYGISAKEIVTGNGVAFTTSAIDAWVIATGGIRLSNGQAVFSGNSTILLPGDAAAGAGVSSGFTINKTLFLASAVLLAVAVFAKGRTKKVAKMLSVIVP